MALRKAWAFFTIEFGRFGWGRTPKATLPHQRGFGIIRISWGRGDIDRGVISQMLKRTQP